MSIYAYVFHFPIHVFEFWNQNFWWSPWWSCQIMKYLCKTNLQLKTFLARKLTYYVQKTLQIWTGRICHILCVKKERLKPRTTMTKKCYAFRFSVTDMHKQECTLVKLTINQSFSNIFELKTFLVRKQLDNYICAKDVWNLGRLSQVSHTIIVMWYCSKGWFFKIGHKSCYIVRDCCYSSA